MAMSDIVGHVRPLKMLTRALRSGRLPHAYLFVGPDGVGKATLALNLAKALQCRKKGADACDSCDSCEMVTRGIHPDVLYLQPEGIQIRIEQIRELQHSMAYRPVDGSRRCVIVDRAHDMTPQAANALLKILEEPPEGNMMILIARTSSVLPPTIVSRCQLISFSPLTAAEVTRCLQDRHGWGREEAIRVGRRSKGSVGTAMKLRDVPLVAEEERVLDFLGNLNTLDASAVLETSRSWAVDRETARSRLETLLGVLRDLVCLRLGNFGVDREELKDLMGEVASRWKLEHLLEGWWRVLEALHGLGRNWNTHLLMDRLLLSLHELGEGVATFPNETVPSSWVK